MQASVPTKLKYCILHLGKDRIDPNIQVGRLIVADTNNSLIRYLDLNMEQAELQTSELKGVEPPASKSESLKRLRNQSSADKRQLKLMVVHPVRATCVSKYHYLKSTISQRPNSTRDQFVVIRDQFCSLL
ncbi:uncharacterized protein [Populus alba]|uniref:uncharacterized protein isoform X3 n=1 Tax=Populus alba TaxID=43335 RepID=UPI003CC74F51